MAEGQVRVADGGAAAVDACGEGADGEEEKEEERDGGCGEGAHGEAGLAEVGVLDKVVRLEGRDDGSEEINA